MATDVIYEEATDEPDDLSAMTPEEAAHYEKIKELDDEVEEAEAVHLAAKEEAKRAKEEWEAAVSRLRRCIKAGPQGMFQTPELPGMDDDSDDVCKTTLIADVLQLTEPQREKLLDAGVESVWDFEQLRGGQLKGYPGGLSDLNRVGEKTIEKWENAVVEWLAENQRVEADGVEG